MVTDSVTPVKAFGVRVRNPAGCEVRRGLAIAPLPSDGSSSGHVLRPECELSGAHVRGVSRVQAEHFRGPEHCRQKWPPGCRTR